MLLPRRTETPVPVNVSPKWNIRYLSRLSFRFLPTSSTLWTTHQGRFSADLRRTSETPSRLPCRTCGLDVRLELVRSSDREEYGHLSTHESEHAEEIRHVQRSERLSLRSTNYRTWSASVSNDRRRTRCTMVHCSWDKRDADGKSVFISHERLFSVEHSIEKHILIFTMDKCRHERGFISFLSLFSP